MKNLIPALICLFLVVPCQARIITVDDDGPADFNNIQEAIDDANNGDIVEVQPGTYTGCGNRNINFLGKAITVRSENGPENCIIDCENKGLGFFFNTSEDSNSVLDGLTITNGYAYEGGGISCYCSSPTVTNCTFGGNYAWYGGGMYNVNSSPTVTNCTFSGNSAADYGGGMYNFSSSPTITNCTITDNSSEYGGGIACEHGSSPTITNCTITNNTATNWGGGMHFIFSSNATINNCVIVDNNRGGILCWDSSPTIANCTISGNLASWGGGIYCYDQSEPDIANCTITSNTAYGGGGGICCFESDPNITNCTISGNTTKEAGGAIFCYTSSPTITNCILWGNTAASDGNEIALVNSSTIDVDYCDIKNGNDGIFIYSGSLINWGTGNIDTDPCFVDPGYWADVNDPNIVVEPNDPNAIWIDGDYHLKSFGWRWDTQRKVWTWDDVTSRCIDAGNPGCPLGEELLSVPYDPNNEWGQNLRINIGAFGGTAEASMPPYDWAIMADLTNDGKVDLNDLAAFVDYWPDSGECIPSDLNRSQFVDFVDFALLAQDWFLETSWHTP